jgi:hypothetical protein
LGGRRNQYDLWPGFADRARAGDRLVLALDEREGEAGEPEVVRRLAPHFALTVRGPLAEIGRGGEIVTRRRVWTLEGWKGTWVAK